MEWITVECYETFEDDGCINYLDSKVMASLVYTYFKLIKLYA